MGPPAASEHAAGAGTDADTDADDRGCILPGRTAPAYRAQVHHLREWADGGAGDIADLTPACEPHHRLDPVLRV